MNDRSQPAGTRWGSPAPLAAAALLLGLWGALAWLGGVGGGVLGGAFFGALAVRLALWWRYRPIGLGAEAAARLPSLTVIVPAFNEGAHVARCLESLVASAYPADRLHVIAVDDGSSDDTWSFIEAARDRHPGRVVAIRLPQNRGKRHALFAGLSRATSELVATVDSDCVVPAESLQALVAPLVADARVGGVAGRVLPLNRRENLLTRMLGVRYLLGFDFVRAYQSELRTVWCCPGAMQAYRRQVIAPHLEAWRDQRFLGASCTNGDDHALTSAVLALGHDTVYQSSATVHTLVPAHYGRLVRMYLRWGRSATREGLRALRFAPSRALRLGGVAGALVALDALWQPLGILLRVTGLVAGLVALVASPLAVAQATLFAVAVALVHVAIALRSERSPEALLGVAYALFAMLALPWVQPLAALTVRQSGWLTRG